MQLPQWVIRPAEAADSEAIEGLWKACALTVWYNEVEFDLALYRDTPNAEMFVAVDLASTLIGTVGVGCDGHRGWLFYLAVAPNLQGGGLGRALVAHAETYLKGIGAPKIMLMIRPSNQRVVKWYERLGYHEDKTLVMAKWLRDLTEVKAKRQKTDGPAELSVTVSYLHQNALPQGPEVALPKSAPLLVDVPAPSVAFFRYLYNTVGEENLWWEKRLMPDTAIAGMLNRDTNHLTIATVGGEPAGFFMLEEEYDDEIGKTVDLAYFGLMPSFIGVGLGKWLLDKALKRAWSHRPKRVTVNTCTLDHPRALGLYQASGFEIVRQQTNIIADPRLLPSAGFKEGSGPK